MEWEFEVKDAIKVKAYKDNKKTTPIKAAILFTFFINEDLLWCELFLKLYFTTFIFIISNRFWKSNTKLED